MPSFDAANEVGAGIVLLLAHGMCASITWHAPEQPGRQAEAYACAQTVYSGGQELVLVERSEPLA